MKGSLWNDISLTLENSLDEVARIFQFTGKPVHHVRIKVYLIEKTCISSNDIPINNLRITKIQYFTGCKFQF